MPGWWFSLGTPVSSTNKTNCHDITEILLNMSLNIINHYDWELKNIATVICIFACLYIKLKLYRKLDVLSEPEYILNFHFNLDSDTDPKLHLWYTWRDYPLHWYMRWRNKWKKKLWHFAFLFLSNFAICHSEIMHDAKC